MNRTFAIISCGASKRVEPSPACELYTGRLFVKQLNYARSIAADDHIRILSAKYGLVSLYLPIAPYNQKLTGRHPTDEWADLIRRQWKHTIDDDIKNLPITLLAGDVYATQLSEALTPLLGKVPAFERPLQHLGMGQQIQWLTERVKGPLS